MVESEDDEAESESSSSGEDEEPARKRRKKDEPFEKKKAQSSPSPRKTQKKKPLDEIDFDRSKAPEKDGRYLFLEIGIGFLFASSFSSPMFLSFNLTLKTLLSLIEVASPCLLL